MTLQEQVTSLELAKKLKELGVPQKSLFYWFHSPTGCRVATREEAATWKYCGEGISAYTVGELFGICSTQAELWKHLAGYVAQHFLSKEKQFIDKENPANSMAKMLIYLIENKLLPIPGRE